MWLAAATALGFGLRIWGIAGLGDLDFDEQASFFIGSMAPGDMLAYLRAAPFEHPPLFYLAFHAWLLMVGGSEPAMRAFAALAGALAVPLLGAAVARAAGPRAGVVAALALAIMPLHMFHSRDARMYTLLALLISIALWAAARAGEKAEGSLGVNVGVTPLPNPPPQGGRGPGTPLANPPPQGGRGPVPSPFASAIVARGLVPRFVSRLQARGEPARYPPRFSVALLVAGLAGGAALATHYYAAFAVAGVAAGVVWAWRGAVGAIGVLVALAGAVGLAALLWLAAAPGLRTSLAVFSPRPVPPENLAAALVQSLGAPLAPLGPPALGAAAAAFTVLVLGAGLWWAWMRARIPSPQPSRPGRGRGGNVAPQRADVGAVNPSPSIGGGAGEGAVPRSHAGTPSPQPSPPGRGRGGDAGTGTRPPTPGPLVAAALGGYVATTVGIPLLLVLGRPFAPRFATLAIPFLVVLLGLATRAVPLRWLLVLGGAYVTFAAVALVPYYDGFTRSDYGVAMGTLRSEVRPADAIVLNGPWQDLLYRRYGAELPQGQIIASTVPLDAREVLPRLQALAGAHPRLWVVDSATDEADPTGAVAGWLDAHAYPRPVLEFRKAVLRPYLTDSQPASFKPRGAEVVALGAQLRTVELEEWAPRAGAEVRLRVTGDDLEPIGGRRLVARLVAANGVEVWHWDGPLARVDGRLSYRAAMVVPPNAEAGMYALQLVVYEVEDVGGGRRRVTRIADPVEVGQVRVTPR